MKSLASWQSFSIKNSMTVHFYTKEPIERPASRQRAFLIAEEFKKHGIPAVIHHPAVETISETRWPKKFLLIFAVIRSLATVKKGDVVFLQRTISNKYFFFIVVLYLNLFRRKMVFDFDDAIYLHSFFKTKVLVQIASAVFVCSTLLQDWVRQYNKNVYIFHTSLNFSWYQQYTKDYGKTTGPCVIGWIGRGEEHVENLKLMVRVLEQLTARGVDYKFLLVGAWKDKRIYELFGRFPATSVELIDYLDWKKIPETIQRFDIGVMPLLDRSVWNRSRSSYKLFEYLAVGIATVSSNNGEISNVIKDGTDGFLADTEEEWVDKLERLVTDVALRAKIGSAGQDMLRTRESYEVVIPRMIEIIKHL